MMSKYCEQCGTELEDNAMFCPECGTKCHSENVEVKERSKENKSKKKIFLIGMGVLLLTLCIIGSVTGFFSGFKKGYEETGNGKPIKSVLTEDGKAYKMTVQEYCDRFNELANGSWCSGDEEILRMEVYEGTLDSLQEAAVYDSEVEELIAQTMTPQMIPGTTLLESEDTDELPSGENYLKYTYTNQYSFIPDNVGVQILALKDTNQIVGVTAQFPMDYRNVGDKFGKLICDSFGNNTDGFQELYIKMKESGGYGHMYKDGTVFELMYYNDSDKMALFKMSACTKEHYEEAWVNNPDLPSKENPIENSEEDSEVTGEENEEMNTAEENTKLDSDAQQNENIDKNIADLIMYFPGFSGVWGDFGVHADPYQGMIEQAIKSKIRLSDYFGGDVNEVSLDISVFQWDGVNVVGAGCILTFEGPSPGNGKFRTLTGVVNVDESGELEFVEGEYY
mgnify:FL=1